MRTGFISGNRLIDTTNWSLLKRDQIGKRLLDDSIYPSADGIVVVIDALGGKTIEEGGSSDDPPNVTLRTWIDNFFTLRLTRKQYHYLCWRIRSFTFEFSSDLVFSDDNVYPRSFNDTLEVRKSQPVGEAATSYDLAAKELDLLHFPTSNYPASDIAVLSPFPGLRHRGFRPSHATDYGDGTPYQAYELQRITASYPAVNDNIQRGFFEEEFPFSIYEEDTDTILVHCPLSVIHTHLIGADPGTGPVASVSANLRAYFTPNQLTGIMFSDYDLPVDFGDAGSSFLRVSGNNGSFSGSFTPESWWAYSTRSGLPVYDTTSGAQINDPMS